MLLSIVSMINVTSLSWVRVDLRYSWDRLRGLKAFHRFRKLTEGDNVFESYGVQ